MTSESRKGHEVQADCTRIARQSPAAPKLGNRRPVIRAQHPCLHLLRREPRPFLPMACPRPHPLPSHQLSLLSGSAGRRSGPRSATRSAPLQTIGGRCRPRQVPGGARPAAASWPARKESILRRIWSVRLTEAVIAKLEAACATMPASKTTAAAYLVDTTCATRYHFRTWLRNDQQMPRLSRPTFFTVVQDATIAHAIEPWTVSGGLLMREMLGTRLCA